jgi:hypothetical protein
MERNDGNEERYYTNLIAAVVLVIDLMGNVLRTY